MTNQLVRSGTSAGANICEAFYTHGKADFIARLHIASKECAESEYWLELLHRTGYIPKNQYNPLQNGCGAIRCMLLSSIKNVKK